MRDVEAARGSPGPACRIVQFRTGEITANTESPCHEHHPVGQQRGRVRSARRIEAAGWSPGPGCRVVQFRARGNISIAIETPSHEHHPVGQQRRRVLGATGVQIARGLPRPAHRVVQFCAGANGPKSPCDQNHPVGQHGRRVRIAGSVEAARGRPQRTPRGLLQPWDFAIPGSVTGVSLPKCAGNHLDNEEQEDKEVRGPTKASQNGSGRFIHPSYSAGWRRYCNDVKVTWLLLREPIGTHSPACERFET
jgi:hypothetical protein